MANMFPVASVEGDDSLIDGLNDKVDVLESKVELLQGTFDVWQGMINPILSSMEVSLQRDGNLIAVLGIVFAIFIAGITYWLTKSRKEAIDDAVKKLDDSLSKGILKEGSKARSKIIDTIIESDEFRLAVEDMFDYPSEAKEVDDDRVNEKQADKEPITPLDTKEKPV